MCVCGGLDLVVVYHGFRGGGSLGLAVVYLGFRGGLAVVYLALGGGAGCCRCISWLEVGVPGLAVVYYGFKRGRLWVWPLYNMALGGVTGLDTVCHTLGLVLSLFVV